LKVKGEIVVDQAVEYGPSSHRRKATDGFSGRRFYKAFVMLEFVTNTAIGSWIAIDYFLVEDGRIKYSRTVYDPRKLIEFMQAQ
jgi:hypothetical protein